MGWFALFVIVAISVLVFDSSRETFRTNGLLGVISLLLLIILLRDLSS